MSESRTEHNENSNLFKSAPARYLGGLYVQDIPWAPFVFLGVLVAILGGIGLSIGSGDLKPYIFAAILGLIVSVVIFQKPEIGAYMLIVSVFANTSSLLTERGLPGINKPLIAVTLLSVLANYLLRTGRYSRFPEITRVQWALIAFYSAIVASLFATPDASYVLKVIIDVTKDILVGISIYITLNTREKWENGLKVFVITIAVLSTLGVFKVITGIDTTFYGLAQLSIFGQVGQGGELRYSGPLGEANLWGQVLVATIPLIVYPFMREKDQRKKLLLGFSLFLVFLASIYTSSRGATVALAAIAPLMALEMRVKPVNIILGVLAVVTLLNILPASYTERVQSLNIFAGSNDPYALNQDDSFVGRKNEMLAGLAMFKDHLFLGVGFGNYGNYYWDYAARLGLNTGSNSAKQQTSRFAHSLYIEVLSETGMLGFITFSVFISLIFADLYKARRKYRAYNPNSGWVSWLTALIFSILTFLVSGLFLHGLLFRYIWMLIGLAFSGIAISQETLKTFQTSYTKKHK